jgi:uncharacterized protein YciI
MELNTYYIGLLRKGPNWTAEQTPALDDLQMRHVAHLLGTMTSGAAVAAGPVSEDEDIRGLTVFRTATLDEARALAEADPAVRAGHFVVDLRPWQVPSGRLPAPAPATNAE